MSLLLSLAAVTAGCSGWFLMADSLTVSISSPVVVVAGSNNTLFAGSSRTPGGACKALLQLYMQGRSFRPAVLAWQPLGMAHQADTEVDQGCYLVVTLPLCFGHWPSGSSRVLCAFPHVDWSAWCWQVCLAVVSSCGCVCAATACRITGAPRSCMQVSMHWAADPSPACALLRHSCSQCAQAVRLVGGSSTG